MNFYYRSSVFVFVLFCLLALPGKVFSQQYELLPFPDLWYNSVDGVRIGATLTGQVPGTFEDGPHRLNTGLWLGTRFPDHPVSYYLRFTEPIPSISGFNSEGSVSLVSSVRTGFSRHGVRFSKRWQPGFDEREYLLITVDMLTQQHFDRSYLNYPALWQQGRLWLGIARTELHRQNGLGPFLLDAGVTANLAGETDHFLRATAEMRQQADLGAGFSLRGRIFLGGATDRTTPEFMFGRSFQSPAGWKQHPLVRARGTLPPSWINNGKVQISGGGNLRGYTEQDMLTLQGGAQPLVHSLGALNLELDYPNPLDRAIRRIPVAGNFLKLRSYLFADAGTSLGIGTLEENRLLKDAGVGFSFSVNIPDFRGNPRGVMLRYDLPLWLSHPGGEPPFALRGIIGIGAIFSI